jgi:hypothetical protein
MRYGDVPNWTVTVRRAQELWPRIPEWAFEMVGQKQVPAGADVATLLPIDPEWIADLAVAAACSRGWSFDPETG